MTYWGLGYWGRVLYINLMKIDARVFAPVYVGFATGIFTRSEYAFWNLILMAFDKFTKLFSLELVIYVVISLTNALHFLICFVFET